MEGMRVEVEPSRATGPQQHGDLVVVTEDGCETLNKAPHELIEII